VKLKLGLQGGSAPPPSSPGVPAGFHFETYPLEQLANPTDWFYINKGEAFPARDHVASGFAPRLYRYPYDAAVLAEMIKVTKTRIYNDQKEGWFMQRIFCEGTCAVVLEGPVVDSRPPIIAAVACCKVMKATSGLPCLYVKTFVSNKQIAMPAKKWQPLAAALKEESGSSLLGKELLAQVCSIVGRMGDNGPAAGHAEASSRATCSRSAWSMQRLARGFGLSSRLWCATPRQSTSSRRSRRTRWRWSRRGSSIRSCTTIAGRSTRANSCGRPTTNMWQSTNAARCCTRPSSAD